MTGATSTLRPREVAGFRVWEGGEGPPVVLLHGLGGSAANWVEVAPLLVPHRRVVAVDLPGHGGSQALSPPAGIDAFADAVAAAIRAAGYGDVLVVGHSFGGHVAARLAFRHPDLVRAALLVCPSGISSRKRVARNALAVTTRLRPTRLVRPFALKLAERRWFRRVVFSPWLAGNAGEVSPRGVRGLVWDAGLHTDLRSAVRAMAADDPRLWLGQVRCPALVLWGARDAQLALEDGFEIARRLRAPLRLIAGCGHLALVERPDAVVDALAALEAQAGSG
jgi:pimeloyl-ACP methyl ester carboxylesterase